MMRRTEEALCNYPEHHINTDCDTCKARMCVFCGWITRWGVIKMMCNETCASVFVLMSGEEIVSPRYYG